MTYRTQTSRLMRRLGFVADPKCKSQIAPADRAIYWRHQPSGALVVTFHATRYPEAQIVRYAISSAIGQTLREVGHKVGHLISLARNENEQPYTPPSKS